MSRAAKKQKKVQLARVKRRLLGIRIHSETAGHWRVTARGHAVWVRPSFRRL